MPRFSDEWVVDRVLFDFVSGGSCACCGFQQFLPNGTADLIGAVSDLETDQANAEIKALEHHPWPADLRDQVWADRVKLRQKMKKEMPKYQEFWEQHGELFSSWCQENGAIISRLIQLPRTEIVEVVHLKYDIHSSLRVVLSAVTEQVAHFQLTQYPIDSREPHEIEFEKILDFNRMGGFSLSLLNGEGIVDDRVLQVLLERIRSLGGPKLLGRAPRKLCNDDDGNADDCVDAGRGSSSFQSDRRIVRLLIARFWGDALMKRYLTDSNIFEARELAKTAGEETKV